MTNAEIVSALHTIGALLEILDDNSFRANAYYAAARRIEALDHSLTPGELESIPGVGKALTAKLTDMLTKGYSPYLNALRAEIPPGLLEILRIPNLGPKRVRQLWRDLGVTTLDELQAACAAGRLSATKGFGDKLQEKILQGIAWVKTYSEKFLLGEALPIGREILNHLYESFHVKHFEIVGSVRRGCELVRNLDILTSVDDPAVLLKFLIDSRILNQAKIESNVITARYAGGLPVRFFFAKPESFGSAQVYFTGSKCHLERLASLARERNIDLRSDSPKASSESEIYERLGLGFIEPELREDTGEVQAAQVLALPDLVSRADITGTFHVHSTWSDGVNSMEDMVAQARTLGLKYVGLSDHSRSASYAGGLTIERLQAQAKEIAGLQAKYPDIRILQGTECDILPDGSLDYPDEVLKKLDFVIGSVHSQFNLSEEQMTSRVIRAMENPYFDILGHPTGRLLLSRAGFKINLERILEAAARLDKTVEINANPHRLDLDSRWARAARDRRVRLSINPDAHSCKALADIAYGVLTARRGWISRENILNAGDPEKTYRYLSRNR